MKMGVTDYDDDGRRGCDMEGTWRCVAITGGEGYAAAIGLTPDLVEAYLESQLQETFSMERLVGGALEVRSTNAAWMPASGLLVLKPGEEFSLDIPGYGKSKVEHMQSLEFRISESKAGRFFHLHIVRGLDMKGARNGSRR